MEEPVKCNNCGNVDHYRVEQCGEHKKAICNLCNKYIKFLPQPEKEFLMPFGKYKDKPLASLKSNEEVRYLNWMLSGDFSKNIKNKIILHLNSIKNG